MRQWRSVRVSPVTAVVSTPYHCWLSTPQHRKETIFVRLSKQLGECRSEPPADRKLLRKRESHSCVFLWYKTCILGPVPEAGWHLARYRCGVGCGRAGGGLSVAAQIAPPLPPSPPKLYAKFLPQLNCLKLLTREACQLEFYYDPEKITLVCIAMISTA